MGNCCVYLGGQKESVLNEVSLTPLEIYIPFLLFPFPSFSYNFIQLLIIVVLSLPPCLIIVVLSLPACLLLLLLLRLCSHYVAIDGGRERREEESRSRSS